MVTHPGSADHARWLAYTVLVGSQVVRAYANRSLREPISRLPANWFLLGAGVAVIAIRAIIPSVPVLADAFRATPLDASDWAVVAIIAPPMCRCGASDVVSGSRRRCGYDAGRSARPNRDAWP